MSLVVYSWYRMNHSWYELIFSASGSRALLHLTNLPFYFEFAPQNTSQFKALQKYFPNITTPKIPVMENFKPQETSFDHPCHSRVPPRNRVDE